MTAGVTMPRRRRLRSTYESETLSRVMPQPTYGFSTGLRSTASPYACSDQLPVPRFAIPLQGEADACLPALERRGEVAVGRPSGTRAVRVGELHVTDREAQCIQPPEDARQRLDRVSVHDELPDMGPAVEPAVGDGEDAQARERHGAVGAPRVRGDQLLADGGVQRPGGGVEAECGGERGGSEKRE